MKLKLLARGKAAEASPSTGATDEEQHNNKKSKEKKSSSKTKSLKESGSTTKTSKEKKSKKQEEKKDGKAGGSTEGESSEPINTKLTGSSRKLRPLSKNQPHDEPSSPRGAAVSKWEQALKEELSRSPPDTPPSNHQRFATAGGAPPAAVPSGPPTETEIEAEERRKRRQQRALESYQNRPRIPTTRRAYEAGVGVGPAEAINRHLRGGGEEGPWLLGAQLAIVPRGEAEGLEVEAGDDWYEQLRSDDEEDIDPEQLLLELAAQQQERELLEQSGLSPRQVLQDDAEPQEEDEKEEGD